MLSLAHPMESEGTTGSMEKYQRLESGTGWLIALVGLGVDYMTGGFSYLGLIVSAVGIAILVHRFWGELRRLRLVLVSGDNEQAHIPPPREMLLALALIPLTLGITVYVFYSSFPSSPVVASGSSTTQMNMSSPGAINALGDVNINQDRRITKEDEFIQKMRAAGPVAVRVETVDGREPEFLLGQLYKLLIDSKWAVEAGGVFGGAVYWVNISVAVRDKDNVPPAAIALVKQLRSNGIESFLVLEKNPAAFVLERNPVTEKADFIVRVGDRPPG